MRQSVGSTPCLLGKAVDCNYIRGPKYLEVKAIPNSIVYDFTFRNFLELIPDYCSLTSLIFCRLMLILVLLLLPMEFWALYVASLQRWLLTWLSLYRYATFIIPDHLNSDILHKLIIFNEIRMDSFTGKLIMF